MGNIPRYTRLTARLPGGFAYSERIHVVKIEFREVQAGWSIVENAGALGGTLGEVFRATVKDHDAAATLRGVRIALALSLGYDIAN